MSSGSEIQNPHYWQSILWFSMVISLTTAFLLGVWHGLSYKLKIHSELELLLCPFSVGQLLIISTMYIMVFKILNKRQELEASCIFFRTNKVFYYLQTITFLHLKDRLNNIVHRFFNLQRNFLPYSVYRIIFTVDETLPQTAKRITWRRIMAFTFLDSFLKFRLSLKRFLERKYES